MVIPDYERVNWQNNINTPLGARNLNKGDKALKDVVDHINKTNSYTLRANSWTGTGSSTYPYMNRISIPGVYTDDDHPIAQAFGMGDIETEAELASISYISKVIVNATGITVYATNTPSVDLKLVLKE